MRMAGSVERGFGRHGRRRGRLGRNRCLAAGCFFTGLATYEKKYRER